MFTCQPKYFSRHVNVLLVLRYLGNQTPISASWFDQLEGVDAHVGIDFLLSRLPGLYVVCSYSARGLVVFG